MRPTLVLLMLLLTFVASGCNGDDDDDGCVQVDVACAPLYTPTFDELHANTLVMKCGLPGTSCHAAEGAQGGLVLDEIETAYNELLGVGDTARVIPNDPACSTVTRRLFASPADAMPPGDPLSPAEQCVFVRWIDDGAQR